MNRQKGFTLIELLVVIAIIALLMAILMPALQRVKKQSKTVACLSLLKQWGIYFSMYTQEYDGYFMQGFNGVAPGGSDNRSAWGYYQRGGWLKPLKGSYGINGWCNNPDPGHSHGGKPEIDHWRTPNVKQAGYIPLFLGAQRYNIWPEQIDAPPDFDGQSWSGRGHMARICLNRHKAFVNTLFLDWSARKVGLKELWVLRWHRSYDIAGPWTMAGGVQPSDWPQWMRRFKAY